MTLYSIFFHHGTFPNDVSRILHTDGTVWNKRVCHYLFIPLLTIVPTSPHFRSGCERRHLLSHRTFRSETPVFRTEHHATQFKRLQKAKTSLIKITSSKQDMPSLERSLVLSLRLISVLPRVMLISFLISTSTISPH